LGLTNTIKIKLVERRWLTSVTKETHHHASSRFAINGDIKEYLSKEGNTEYGEGRDKEGSERMSVLTLLVTFSKSALVFLASAVGPKEETSARAKRKKDWKIILLKS
jgi:hypothetical protein